MQVPLTFNVGRLSDLICQIREDPFEPSIEASKGHHMKRVIAILLISMGCTTLGARRLPARGSQCLPSGPTATVVRDLLVRYATDSSAGVQRARSLFQLPLVNTADVQQVTDSATCAQAAAAQYPTQPTRAVLVFRVGPTRFVVHDRTTGPSEFEALAIYDASFAYLTAITM